MTESHLPLESPRLTTPRAAAVAGIVFALLFAASLLLTRQYIALDAPAPQNSVLGWFARTGAVSQYLVPFAGIAFLWFIGVVRDLIGAREDRFFATVFLGSGILFVAMMFCASASLAALRTLDASDPAAVSYGRALAGALIFLYCARTAGVFTIVTSTIVLRTEAAPRWVAITGFVLGLVLLLTISWVREIILIFPLWVAIVSVVAMRTANRRSTT